MNRFLIFGLCSAIIWCALPARILAQNTPAVFFVSPQGNDAWSGTLGAANQNNTDGPFATLERARDAVRTFRQRTTPHHPITVYLRGGVYQRREALTLGPLDGGSSASPVTWRSYPGETARLIGSTPVSHFIALPDSVARRLPSAAAPHVVVANLREQGIRDFGVITPRGGPGLELFFNGERMTMARWPNAEWERIADVPQTGDTLFNKGLDREKRFDGVPVGRHYGRITYAGDRPNRWSRPGDIFLHGYWTWDWSDSYQRVKSIDTLHHEITLQEPHHHYGYTKNQRFYYVNILEELDVPGEWFLDRTAGLLYFWPPAPLEGANVTVSLLDAPFITLTGSHYTTFRGIAFGYSRAGGVVISGGDHNLLAGCDFRYLGGDAVIIDGGTFNGVTGCDISNVAMAGIRIKGGDRLTLSPGGNFAENCHIHHYSSWIRTGQYAAFLDGVGNRLSNCLIHDAPFEAIYLRGNDHVIEYNEIHSVTQETGDAGALHTGRDWTWRGNMIRYNYFHHLLGPGLHGVMAVYLDDFSSGFTVFGNVFYKAGRAAFIGGGRDNTIENNIFVGCTPSVHIDARGLSWAGYYMDGKYPELFTLMDAVHYNKPPYSTRYPELLTLYATDPAVPRGNKVIRNISMGGRWLDVYDYNAFDFSVVTMKDNVIADSLLWRRLSKGTKGWDPYYLNIDTKEGYDLLLNEDAGARKELQGNIIMQGDPGFVNAAQGDFHLRPNARALSVGFQPIPFEKIGLISNEDRALIPRDNYRRED